MAKVFIGVDPHKLSAKIEVVDEHESAEIVADPVSYCDAKGSH